MNRGIIAAPIWVNPKILNASVTKVELKTDIDILQNEIEANLQI